MFNGKDILSFIMTILLSQELLLAGPLHCDAPIKDFRKVEEGRLVTHTFTVKNMSDGPVFVKRIFSTCGCLVSSRKQFTLGPNGSTDIPIEFNTSGYGGRKFEKDIAIFFDEAEQEKIFRLKIKGEVEGAKIQDGILISPKQRFILGEKGEQHCLFIRAPLREDLELTLKTPEWIAAKIEKTGENEALKISKWKIVFSLTKNIEHSVNAEITLRSNVPSFEKLSVPIYVESTPRLMAHPPVLLFRKEESRTTYMKELDIILLRDSSSQSNRHGGTLSTESANSGRSGPESCETGVEMGTLPIVVKPSNDCISVTLTRISHDFTKLGCKVSVRCGPLPRLNLQLVRDGTCIMKVPICFLPDN
jgi:hypothetical protein